MLCPCLLLYACRIQDEAKYVWEDSTGKVVAIYNHKEQTFPAEAGSDAGKLGILLDKTNFYSEAGGQVWESRRQVEDSS